MRIYQRIDGVADWERLRLATAESWEVDFKAELKSPNHCELAKDVAAFANYLGGVILVGVSEKLSPPTPSRRPEEELKATQRAFEEAVKDRCRPAPIVTYARFDLGPEGWLLAVNVDPLPDAIVGAAFGDKNSGLWRFPVRANQHTICLSPEQLPMYMNATARSVLIRVSQIPVGEQVEVTFRRPDNPTAPEASCVAIRILEPPNVEGNYLAVCAQHTTATHVPLDDIESIWKASDGKWKVRVSGHFAMDRGGSYQSNPRTRTS